MKLPTVPGTVQDRSVAGFLQDLYDVLRPVEPTRIYEFTTICHFPMSLQITTLDGQTRNRPPKCVTLLRAVVTESITDVVLDLGVTYAWKGGNSVSILDIAGLVESVKYDFCFEVTG